MTYIVARVSRWHGRFGRSAAKTVSVQLRTASLTEAVDLRRRLNLGRKQQRYWVLDEKGRVVSESKIHV